MRLEPINSPKSPLARLIRDDAPLQSNNLLVLMYGPFQAEMSPGPHQGIRSWILTQMAEHGFPSLVRFGRRDRPSVYRRDEFAPWITPMMDEGTLVSST